MLKRFFPTLAEWPVEKVAAAPLVAAMIVAPISSIVHDFIVWMGWLVDPLR